MRRTLIIVLVLLFANLSFGATGAPPTLIAHYKFNEDTAGDNAELVTNGTFDNADWSGDNPTGWLVDGESAPDPEISEVGDLEGHGGTGTGMCNLYSSGAFVGIIQTIDLVVGRKYRVSININKVTTGGIKVYDQPTEMFTDRVYDTTGIKTFTFVATETSMSFRIARSGATDVTFDDVSIKLLAVEDSSGNHHDGLAQQQTSDIHVTGKINGAFDFTSPDHIVIPDHDDFTPAGTPLSISAWVYMHVASDFTIASKGVLNTDGEWWFWVDSGDDKIRWRIFDESVDNCYLGVKYSAAALTSYEGQWIHLVATYDGSGLSSGMKICLNGTRIDDTILENFAGSFDAVENLNHDVWIGRYSAKYANGLIDNIAFFSKILTIDEVRRLYNNRNGTEILAEVDSVISPRRSNTSPLGLRKRYEF